MLWLDHSIDNFERKSFIANELLVIKGYFLGSMKDMTIFRI